MTITELFRDSHERRDSRESTKLSALNAWFFDSIDTYGNHIARAHKRSAFDGIEPGRILEIRAGTAANFAYLPPNGTIVALEPNVAVHEALERRAGEYGMHLKVLTDPAETMPLEDDSVDTVIATLVLRTSMTPTRSCERCNASCDPTERFGSSNTSPPAAHRRADGSNEHSSGRGHGYSKDANSAVTPSQRSTPPGSPRRSCTEGDFDTRCSFRSTR